MIIRYAAGAAEGEGMAEHFQTTAESLFRGMEEFVTTKTVVGDAIHVGDTTILPLVDVSFGMMASSRNEEKRSNGGGGLGGKMTPSAVLVIRDGQTRILNVRSQDTMSKLIDMAPDLINRFMPGKSKSGMDAETDKAVHDAASDEKTFKS